MKRITCSKCRQVKVYSKFFNDEICKECLYICHRCDSNIGYDKICPCNSVANKLLVKKKKFLQLFHQFDSKFQMFGLKLCNTFIRGGYSFCVDRTPIFTKAECRLILKWMSRSKSPIEDINFDTPQGDKALRYGNNLITLLS